MHDGSIVIRCSQRVYTARFSEIAFFAWLDIFKLDFDIIIAVWTRLLVKKAKSVTWQKKIEDAFKYVELIIWNVRIWLCDSFYR